MAEHQLVKMADTGTPPSIPTEFQVYDSYTTDPIYQLRFTYVWTVFLALSLLISVPWWFLGWYRSGNWSVGWAGITEDLSPRVREGRVSPTTSRESAAPRNSVSGLSRSWIATKSLLQSLSYLSLPLPILRKPPSISLTPSKLSLGALSELGTQFSDCCRKGYLPLTVGQIVLVLGYTGLVLACMLKGAELNSNSNRAGFLALAQLTPLFLLTLKSSPLTLLMPLSHLHLNAFHRWAGRLVFLCATIHGFLWINQFLSLDEMDQIATDKVKRGLASWVLLAAMAISSVRPIRRRWYQVFFALHLSCFVGFFAAVSYHTPYSRPWIYPPIALYAYDLAVRLFRQRIKDAILVALDDGLTMIHIPDCDAGWLPTQHINLRVLAGGGLKFLESHPFTITNAPAPCSQALGALSGITLYAKTCGAWTKRLNDIAKEGDEDPSRGDTWQYGDGLEDEWEMKRLVEQAEAEKAGSETKATRVRVIVDGPYGGLKMDMASFGEVLLVAGGSGITFALGSIEECFRKALSSSEGKAQRVTLIWCVKDMTTANSMAPTLAYLFEQSQKFQGLELVYHLYLTEPPHPLPTGPPASLPSTTSLFPYRPSVSQLIKECLKNGDTHSVEMGVQQQSCPRRGVAVIACGPEGIVAESRNAVALLGLRERLACGGVEFHGEGYAI